MAAPDRRSLVESIRAAARLAIEATSLRAVARDVGMSPMGLKHFVAGTQPYSATSRKLLAWYAVYQADAGGSSVESIRAALELMTNDLPVPSRDEGVAILLAAAWKHRDEIGVRQPGWLVTLRAEHESNE